MVNWFQLVSQISHWLWWVCRPVGGAGTRCHLRTAYNSENTHTVTVSQPAHCQQQHKMVLKKFVCGTALALLGLVFYPSGAMSVFTGWFPVPVWIILTFNIEGNLQQLNPEAIYDGVLKPDSIATTIISNFIGFIASSLALLLIAPLYQVVALEDQKISKIFPS